MKDLIMKLTANKKNVVLLLFSVGIILILLSYIMPKDNINKQTSFSEADYIAELEQRVCALVSSIDGAGECTVMINISSTIESVYVKENKKSFDNDETKSKGETEDSVLTMTDSSGNQSAVVTKQIMPKVSGVTVVCDGANDSRVQSGVITAVSTLLDIGSNKVCVIAKAK